jgi:hypothetical protein
LARFIDIDATPPRTIDFRGMFVWLLAGAMLAGACLVSWYALDPSGAKVTAQNAFASYYCAGGLARNRQDPYSASPQSNCEHAGRVVAPAALPGYDIAPFALAAFAPYRYALIAWEALLFIAIVATLWALRALTGLPRVAIAAALIATEAAGSLAFGQLAPIAVLGVALAGLSLTRNAPRSAAYSAGLALALPQIGLPVVVAMFFFAPRTRWTLLLVLALFGAVSFLLLGPLQNLEYLRQALPASLATDLALPAQFSLAWVLNFFRDTAIPDALKYGALQYAAVVLLAVLFAPRVARALDAPAALVAFPAAATVLGGISAQSFDLAAAIPFAILLASRPSRLRGAGWLALALLAVPWNWWQVGDAPEQSALGAVALAIIVVAALHERPLVGRFAIALGAVALLVTAPHLLRDLPAFWALLIERTPGWLALLLLFCAGLATVPPRPADEEDEELQMDGAF